MCLIQFISVFILIVVEVEPISFFFFKCEKALILKIAVQIGL